jgi:hypothetical protein
MTAFCAWILGQELWYPGAHVREIESDVPGCPPCHEGHRQNTKRLQRLLDSFFTTKGHYRVTLYRKSQLSFGILDALTYGTRNLPLSG